MKYCIVFGNDLGVFAKRVSKLYSFQIGVHLLTLITIRQLSNMLLECRVFADIKELERKQQKLVSSERLQNGVNCNEVFGKN